MSKEIVEYVCEKCESRYVTRFLADECENKHADSEHLSINHSMISKGSSFPVKLVVLNEKHLEMVGIYKLEMLIPKDEWEMIG